MRPCAVVAPCMLVLLTSACGSERDSEVISVEAMPTLAVQHEQRLGDVDDPERGFTIPLRMDIDGDGNLYVLEASAMEIRVLDPAGTVLGRIGRRGDGPGEFGAPPQFGVVGDTVWAVDPRLNRITLFDRGGEVLSTGRTDGLPVALPGGYGYVRPSSMRQDGLFRGDFSRVSYSAGLPATQVEPTDSIPWPVVLFDATGAIVDTIGSVHRPPPRMWRPPSEDDMQPRFVQIGDRRLIVPDPPTALPFWEPVSDGYVMVETPRPSNAEPSFIRVTRISFTRDTVYDRSLRYAPEPYESGELDSIAARVARGGGGGIVGASPTASVPDDWRPLSVRLRAEMDFPEFKLPVDRVWVGPDDSVWLRLTTSDGSGASRWLLMHPSGAARGVVEFPGTARPIWAGNDSFWAVEEDELGVPWLVGYRIGPA